MKSWVMVFNYDDALANHTYVTIRSQAKHLCSQHHTPLQSSPSSPYYKHDLVAEILLTVEGMLKTIASRVSSAIIPSRIRVRDQAMATLRHFGEQ